MDELTLFNAKRLEKRILELESFLALNKNKNYETSLIVQGTMSHEFGQVGYKLSITNPLYNQIRNSLEKELFDLKKALTEL